VLRIEETLREIFFPHIRYVSSLFSFIVLSLFLFKKKRFELRNRMQIANKRKNRIPSFASHKKYLKMGRYVHVLKNCYDYDNACDISCTGKQLSIISRFLSSNYIYSFINSCYISSMIPRDLEMIVKQGLSSFINFNAIEINYIYYKNYFNRESKSSGWTHFFLLD